MYGLFEGLAIIGKVTTMCAMSVVMYMCKFYLLCHGRILWKLLTFSLHQIVAAAFRLLTREELLFPLWVALLAIAHVVANLIHIICIGTCAMYVIQEK